MNEFYLCVCIYSLSELQDIKPELVFYATFMNTK
jgi:hypothetical protein